MKNENGYLDPTCYYMIVPKTDIFGYEIEEDNTPVASSGIAAPDEIVEPAKNN